MKGISSAQSLILRSVIMPIQWADPEVKDRLLAAIIASMGGSVSTPSIPFLPKSSISPCPFFPSLDDSADGVYHR